jgi:integrase
MRLSVMRPSYPFLASSASKVSKRWGYVLHSLRKYRASTTAQQGVPPMALTKMFGHTDLKLTMNVYYTQHDDALKIELARKVDFRLQVSKVG